MNRTQFAIFCLSVASCFSQANAANLVTNGDFESIENTSRAVQTFGNNSQDLTGWIVGLNSVDLVDNSVWNSASGSYSLDLNGTKKGEIHQSLNTVNGQHYQLSFDLAGNFSDGLAIKTLSVNLGPNGIYKFDTRGKSASNMGWTHYTTTFVALSNSTTLSFLSNVRGNAGPALDNIAVTAVPEPETFAMLMTGLGLMGAIARRRNKTRT